MPKNKGIVNQDILMPSKKQALSIEESLGKSEPNKLLIEGFKSNISDLNREPCFESEEKEEIIEAVKNRKTFKAQDAHDGPPKLFLELEVEIFARVSYVNYWKLHMINKKYSQLLQSREVFKVRREHGLVEPYVFMLPNGENCWIMFDKDFKNYRKLPKIPSEYCLFYGEKESISAGTHLIVIVKEMQRSVVWRYELEMNKWIKDSEMITPKVMYGSASHGSIAFFAGGFKLGRNGVHEVTNVAEKYNTDTKTWTMISGMHKRRNFSSGCFLRGKFYVIGGRDENNVYLTCGESYNEETNSWNLIPDMLKNMLFMALQSPPFIAIVNDDLYLLEIWYNKLFVYDILTNTWKSLGVVPVKSIAFLGWGVAFKSIGDRFLLIGPSSKTMSVYTCRPSPNVSHVIWEEINYCDGLQFNYFIRNLCVMFA